MDFFEFEEVSLLSFALEFRDGNEVVIDTVDFPFARSAGRGCNDALDLGIEGHPGVEDRVFTYPTWAA